MGNKHKEWTATYSISKYSWFTDEIIEFVRKTELEKDAVENLKRIMAIYEKRKTFWQKIRSLF